MTLHYLCIKAQTQKHKTVSSQYHQHNPSQTDTTSITSTERAWAQNEIPRNIYCSGTSSSQTQARKTIQSTSSPTRPELTVWSGDKVASTDNTGHARKVHAHHEFNPAEQITGRKYTSCGHLEHTVQVQEHWKSQDARTPPL